MTRTSLFHRLFLRAARRPNRPATPPWLEALEERTLPTVYGPPSAIDLTSGGATANNGAIGTNPAQVSADGHYAVFVSYATDLNVANFSGTLPGYYEVYLRDLVNGTTTLVSISPNGQAAANSTSYEAVLSANGQYVAFQSSASNLVSGVSGTQIYVWNRTTGQVSLVSVGAGSGGNESAEYPSISSNGQVIGYDSNSSNLVAGVANPSFTSNVYAYHLNSGVTEMASIATDGTDGGNGSSTTAQVSADGSTVAFLSYASNLAPNTTDNNSTQDVYARRLSTSSVSPNTTFLVSAEVSASSTANSTSTATGQAVSGDGRYEVFTSAATDLIAGISTSNQENVYLRDRTTGAITLVSAAPGSGGLTGGNGYSDEAVISADGRYVAFASAASDLVSVPSGEHLSYQQVYVWDRTTGLITLASPGDDGGSTGNLGGNYTSGNAISISDASQTAGGTVVVAYDSAAGDLDPTATASRFTDDVYAFNLGTGKVQLVSLASDGVHSGNNQSTAPVVSADGSTVAFLSSASNLDPAATDNNGTQDIYARRLSAAHPVLVSAEVSGTSTANGTSTATGQAVSADGRYEVFLSSATDLVAGISTGGDQQVYLRDRTTGAITLVSAAPGSGGLTGGNGYFDEAVISADGRYVAFASAASDLVSVPSGEHLSYQQVYVWDRTTGLITLASPGDDGGSTGNLGGNYTSGNAISISDASQTAGGTVVVAYDSAAGDLDPSATASRFTDDVYAFNLGTGKVQLVSLASDGAHSGNDSSSSPVISADGSTVAFVSNASNLDPNATDNNSAQDIYARRLSAAHPVLVSLASDGVHSGNGASYDPVLSANGQYVAFDSYDTNLTALDTGGQRDVYVRDLIANATTLISVNAAGTGGGTGGSDTPSLSGDGSKVAFDSSATNLTGGVSTGYQNIYVRSWQGTGPSTTLLTPNAAGSDGGNSTSENPVLSADGSTVAFVSAATDLLSGVTTSGYQVYVKPLGGAPVLATPGLGGSGGNAQADTSTYVSLSKTGAVAAFDNNSSDLVAGDVNDTTDVFDFAAGAIGVVSAKPAGTFSGNSSAYDPVLSANGQYVAFDSYDTNLTALPTSGSRNVYVRDLNAGATTLISVNAAGTAGGAGNSDTPSLNSDGSKVAFDSSATDLTGGVSSGNYNIYMRSWQGGSPATVLETPNSGGSDGGNNYSYNPVLSADGSTVAFVSAATNLISGLTANGHYQDYVKPLGGATVLASPGSGDTGGNADADTSNFPALDANGDTLLYDSSASDLVANDNNNTYDVFAVKSVTLSVGGDSGSAPSSGTTTFPFTVSLSTPITQTVTVQYATGDGTAHAPGDYQSTSGTLTFTPGGAASQTINVTVNGTTTIHPAETFSVTLSSPSNASIASGTGTGTILTNDTTPVANNDSYAAQENGQLTVAAPGVLANDTHTSGTTLTATLVSGVSHGSLTFDSNGDGGFTYTPSSNYSGADSFTYKANDGIFDSNTATVNLTVAAVPVATGQSVATGEGQAKAITLITTDPNNDPLSYTIVSGQGPLHDTLSGTAPNLTYTPSTGYTGNDSFQFTVTDQTTGFVSNTATVGITVLAPVAVASAVTNGDNAALVGPQRSMVDSVVYTFNHVVTLAAGAFTIALHANVTVNGSGGQTVGTVPNLSWSSPDGGTTWVVTFSGPGVVNHSIADGVYDLTLNASAVSDAAGQALASSRTDTFFRLYGDTNGDGTVDGTDAAAEQSSFLKRAGNAAYLAYLDYNGDGIVNATDALQFKKRYSTAYSGFTATL